MSERELQAVQQAYHDADEAGCTIDQCWQAAISASDAQYVKGLVEALKKIEMEGTVTDEYGTYLNFFARIANTALKNLPQDLVR